MYISKEYIENLQSMKPSKIIEEIFGIKLLYYQKILIDLMDKNYITFSPRRNCVNTKYIKAIMDTLYPINK